jgi:hypothetical protein
MSLRHEVCFRRLQVLGVSPRNIQPIIREIDLWIKHNGPEWAIARLKTMKVSFLQKTVGIRDNLYPWISTSNNVPTGPLSCLFKLKNAKKTLNSLMIYSDLVSPRVTKRQWKKFSESAHQKNVKEIPINWYSDYRPPVKTVNDSGNIEVLYPQSLSSFKFKGRIDLRQIRTPQWESDRFMTGDNTPKNMVKSFNHVIARQYMNKHMDKDSLPLWVKNSILKEYKDINNVMYSLSHTSVGRISFIQEPGYKLRAIANPHPSFQVLTSPLKGFVMNGLKRLHEDYCHNQQGAFDEIRQYLSDDLDHRLSSIDLSDATNNIPLTPQLELLESLLGPNHPQIELFRDISRGEWNVASPSGETTITFNNGHPLGTGPSFGLFSLFHHFVVRCAISVVDKDDSPLRDFFRDLNFSSLEHDNSENPVWRQHCLNRTVYPYWIVGDDIVINSKYERSYLDIMNGYYKVPISFDKCLFNVHAAEFCSRLITEKSVYPAYKWKTVHDESFIEVARHMGPKSLPLFRPKQQKVLKQIAYIPDTLNGPISWNPKGLPLSIRENMYWDDANKLLSLSNDTTNYIKRQELDYNFLKELGLILTFSNHSLQDLHTQSVPISNEMKDRILSSRQRDLLWESFSTVLYKEGDMKNQDLSYRDTFIRVTLREFPDLHSKSFTEFEASQNPSWIEDTYFSHINESNKYFQKLCKLYNL